MSQPRAARTIYGDDVDFELARWPGVTCWREVRGKHYALVLAFRGQTRFVIYPGSPSDSGRGSLNHLQNVRAELRLMGAWRMVDPKSSTPHRRRNRTEPRRVVITDRATGGPKRDPWAALATLDLTPAEVVEKPSEPRQQHSIRQPWWRRVIDFIRGHKGKRI